MRGDVDTIKERLDIAEVVSGYIKVEKAGANFKARCPFHNEKTPSFFISSSRQSFYCFGCGAKGDIFSFVEQMEGLEFREALKLLADKAGVELENIRGESKTEKDKIFSVLQDATKFFESELEKNEEAKQYVVSRGIDIETAKNWHVGYAPAEWRSLSAHLHSLGYETGLIVKAGLIKTSDASQGKEPYDVFRDRIIFPLSDANGKVIAFSGRALSKDTEPKYLNSPDTILFTKSEVLYGLDRAKNDIRKKDYAVLVEGQMDLVLSHQAGVGNTVASSGTAFTQAHLERLKRLSARIILAFDGDKAGLAAAEKAATLAISLGLEVKIASLPEGSDPADVAQKDPEEWKNILRKSLPAVEYFFNKVEEAEPDPRKLGKLIVQKILPMIKLLRSSIEQSHFISLIAQRTGIKEAILWDDLKKVKIADAGQRNALSSSGLDARSTPLDAVRDVSLPQRSQRENIEERLAEIKLWKRDLATGPEIELITKEETELENHLAGVVLKESLGEHLIKLSRAEKAKDIKVIADLTQEINKIHSQIRVLEEKKKIM